MLMIHQLKYQRIQEEREKLKCGITGVGRELCVKLSSKYGQAMELRDPLRNGFLHIVLSQIAIRTW